MTTLRRVLDRWSGLLLALAPAAFYVADALAIELSDRTVYAIVVWFIVVSGVNLSTWARQAGHVAAALSSVQKALDRQASDGPDEGAS